MKKIVFYSWQSDLPNSTNRGFIQTALEKAVVAIAKDDSVAVEPVVDRDTQGVAGSPDIASTIFAKITASDVFVADVSIILRPKSGRPMPNPNVLIELGYALKCLGHERMVLVFNRSFGKIEDLPFDLRTRRLVVYDMSPENAERAPERGALEKQLEMAIRSALEHAPTKEPEVTPVITAIENNQSNKIIVLRRSLSELLKKINDRQPKKHSDGGTVEEFITSISSTQEVVAEFSRVVEIVSIMKDTDSAIEIYKWFGNIFEQYKPKSKDGRTSNADGDYFKFVGHEMFVTMTALYLREQRWDILKNLLTEAIPVKYLNHENSSGNVYWHYASEHLPLLLDESRKNRRLSMHADILDARHTEGGLSAIMPMEEFANADFFLFLLSELPPVEFNGRGVWEWRPWSVLFMKQTPLFIKNAEQGKYAQHLMSAFNISTVEELKKRLKERYPLVHNMFTGGYWHTSISDTDIDKIATR